LEELKGDAMNGFALETFELGCEGAPKIEGAWEGGFEGEVSNGEGVLVEFDAAKGLNAEGFAATGTFAKGLGGVPKELDGVDELLSV
jgi:hypothetical protein